MQPYVEAKMFMGSVLVASKGRTIFNNAYGMADLEWSVPNSPTTRFNIASMTKQFTAAAILLLEDRGKLKTSDPVKKYLPDAPASWDNITIYHLLTHTSGIPDDAAKYQPGPPDLLLSFISLLAMSLANCAANSGFFCRSKPTVPIKFTE
jgi:CubicO group peptidase (beta-lactamase class C family)